MKDAPDTLLSLFLGEVDAFKAATGQSDRAISLASDLAPDFLTRVRRERSCTFTKADAVRAYMAGYRDKVARLGDAPEVAAE